MEGEREQQEKGKEKESDRGEDLRRSEDVRKLQAPEALRQQRGPEGALQGGRLDRRRRRNYLQKGRNPKPLSTHVFILFSFSFSRSRYRISIEQSYRARPLKRETDSERIGCCFRLFRLVGIYCRSQTFSAHFTSYPCIERHC